MVVSGSRRLYIRTVAIDRDLAATSNAPSSRGVKTGAVLNVHNVKGVHIKPPSVGRGGAYIAPCTLPPPIMTLRDFWHCEFLLLLPFRRLLSCASSSILK